MAEQENKPIIKYNYKQDKNGWVVFKSGKTKKVKLRVHISMLATDLTRNNNKTYRDNREMLIEGYEAFGLEGMTEFYKELIVEIYNNKLELIKKQKQKLEDENKSKVDDADNAH